MSDFYLCEHEERCCGTCIRATKTENIRLQSEVERLTAKLKKLDCEFDIDHSIMQDKVDALSQEVKRLREALEKIAGIDESAISHVAQRRDCVRWAKEALCLRLRRKG